MRESISEILIGMHLKDVGSSSADLNREIGGAHVVCARTRPKFIGGERARYDERKL